MAGRLKMLDVSCRRLALVAGNTPVTYLDLITAGFPLICVYETSPGTIDAHLILRCRNAFGW